MTRPSKFLGTLLGEWHTENYVAAVIDDLHKAERAVAELEQAGWEAKDVRLFQGKPVAEKIDTIEEHRSVPTRIASALRGATSEEGPISEEYEQEAEAGHQIIAVYTPDEEQVERVRRILAGHQAHAIEYFGGWAITDLPEQTEPPPPV
jgi:hypothetical protein